MQIAETLSYEIVTTAARAAQLHRRGRDAAGFASIEFLPCLNPAEGWELSMVALNKKDGGVIFYDMTRPVDERSPFADDARERLAAAERLALLLDLLPDEARGEILRIPLTRN